MLCLLSGFCKMEQSLKTAPRAPDGNRTMSVTQYYASLRAPSLITTGISTGS